MLTTTLPSAQAQAYVVLLAVFALQCRHDAKAVVVVEPQTLQESVRDAELVVRGTVVAISTETYTEGIEQLPCGSNYSVQVLETYKGPRRAQVDFAAYSTPLALPFRRVQKGDELLLLLSYNSSLSDPMHREVPDLLLAKPADAKRECLSRLSRVRPSDLGERAFLLESIREPSGQAVSVWLTFMRSRTLMPKNTLIKDGPYDPTCRGEECSSDPRQRALWPPLEELVREWTKPPE